MKAEPHFNEDGKLTSFFHRKLLPAHKERAELSKNKAKIVRKLKFVKSNISSLEKARTEKSRIIAKLIRQRSEMTKKLVSMRKEAEQLEEDKLVATSRFEALKIQMERCSLDRWRLYPATDKHIEMISENTANALK